ncbi:acetyltransferase, partial [Aspergillus bombycis]
MPSILEDPTTTLPAPQPAQQASQTLTPRPAHLKDGSPVTLYPVANGPQSVPADLVALLQREFSAEIQAGCTYPMEEPMTLERFAEYWFGTFAVVAVLGEEEGLREGRDWERECLGTFYIKPNYP